MRFGFDLHQHLVPEWASLYVPYNLFKVSFKAIVENSITENTRPDFSELYTSISSSIDTLRILHQQQCKFLYAVQADLSSEDHAPEPVRHRSHSSSSPNLRRTLEKLLSFHRVNEEALDRIYGKIERCGSFPVEFHQEHKSNWIKTKVDFQEELLELSKNIGQIETTTTGTLCRETTLNRSVPLAAEDSAFDSAIQNDEPSTLANLLEAIPVEGTTSRSSKALFYHLMETSIIHHSEQSTRLLLSQAFSVFGVTPDYNLLNRLITRVGHAEEPLNKLQSMQVNQSPRRTCQEWNAEAALAIIADQVYHDKRGNTLAKDHLGRSSLHYSALYGLGTLSQVILRHVHALGSEQVPYTIFSLDSQGYTPFHYAVVEHHVAVARNFIDILVQCQSSKPNDTTSKSMQALLNIALRYQFDDMVEMLAEALPQFKGSADAESPLYVAAQIGRDDYLKILLQNGQTAQIDSPEPLHGWSPLFIACIKGHQKAVEVLLQAGANQDVCDFRGWYAKEHAALRGHFSLTGTLKPWDNSLMVGGPSSLPLSSCTVDFSLPVDVDHVIINIGALQNANCLRGVDFKMHFSKDRNFARFPSPMEMSVSVEGSVSHLVHLPVLSDMGNEPFIFPIRDPHEVPLIFKLTRPDCSSKGRKVVGSAATILSIEADCFGPTRESLFRGRTIPILATETLELLGTVTFTFLIAKRPVNLRAPQPIERYTPEKAIQLVGHRGSGQNTADQSYLQLGENTIESILFAANQGASYVEFDVQLTRDLVPVVFHDFSLSESGTDIPIHDLTAEQFKHASKLQSPSEVLRAKLRHRNRSPSLTIDMQEIHPILDRMKYTVDYQSKGFKPNTRGSFIQGPFATLKELLVNLPASINFNVEIKYPRFHEAIEAGVAPVALEINVFVDRILDQIFHHARGRRIILSSFTPEICILLSVKQKTYPVMFITNAGKLPVNDLETRACSVEAAVRFSKRWNLAGIVFASDILLMCPRLVGYVRNSGFTCGSYGSLNNVPENVIVQQAAGIQMLMADRVGLVARVLNESQTQSVC